GKVAARESKVWSAFALFFSPSPPFLLRIPLFLPLFLSPTFGSVCLLPSRSGINSSTTSLRISWAMGADSWSTSQFQHHEPCDQASWLDTQEKGTRCDRTG